MTLMNGEIPPNKSRSVWRWLRWIVSVLVTVPLVVIAIAHFWLGCLADAEWKTTKARLDANHYSLEFADISPRPVLNKDNFFAIEPLRDIGQVEDGDEDKGLPGARRQRLKDLALPVPANGERPQSRGVDFGQAWSAKAWADYYRQTGGLDLMPASESPVNDLLDGLASRMPLMSQLADAAALPHAQILPLWRARNETDAADSRIGYFASLFAATKTFECAAQAKIAASKPEDAAGLIAAVFRFADGAGNEPLLINSLVSLTYAKIALEPTWSLLAARKADEPTLLLMGKTIERINVTKAINTALAGEMIWSKRVSDAAIADRAFASKIADMEEQFGQEPSPSLFSKACRHVNQRACIVGESAIFLRSICVGGLEPLNACGLSGMVRSSSQSKQSLDTRGLAFYAFGLSSEHFVKMIEGIARRGLLTEARLRQARIAVALERFHLANGHYPPSLVELTPGIVSKVPLDPIDDKPMRYERTANRYKLWSLGFDGDDDGGKVVSSNGDSDPQVMDKDYPGDWVWSYEPLVPAVSK